MAPTTRAGLLVLVLSVPLWAGGIWLVRDARARQPPVVAAHRTLAGSVADVVATPCSARRTAGTCFRTVAAYVDGGQSRQIVSRNRYRPARHQRGEVLSVLVEANGTTWIDTEWQDHQAERLRRFEDGRRFPLVMGWILIGCASFGVLLGLGLIFWVDRSVRTPNALAAIAVPMVLLAASAAGNGLRQVASPVPTLRMADGRLWTARNLDIVTGESYCYESRDDNCRRYGRLYTWVSAQRVCAALGQGWHLPTNDEWRLLGRHYGGIRQDSADLGRAAYDALKEGGRTGFEALLGGGREPDGTYARADAHGFFWSASESSPTQAWFYNIGRNGQSFGHHSSGEKDEAFSVRCVRD